MQIFCIKLTLFNLFSLKKHGAQNNHKLLIQLVYKPLRISCIPSFCAQPFNTLLNMPMVLNKSIYNWAFFVVVIYNIYT